MYNSGKNIMEKVKPMLIGNELREQLRVLPDYDESIRGESQSVRLMELNKLNSFYLPSEMSMEIYTELYLAMVKSMQKKESRLAVMQRNINGHNLKVRLRGEGTFFDGIMGGSDSFSVLGCSGIGKTTALAKAVRLLEGERIIELENPFCKIIPVINVQCPFDCSARSMLLAVLQKVDSAIGTVYYNNAIKSRANTNMILVSTSQVLLNHVSVVCIDEIQNLIKHRAGMQLVSMLTELLNESGVSIVFVGTPEIEPFFQSVDYLARRTLGLHYNKCEYNQHFRKFCSELWQFQYVENKSGLTDGIVHWLYQHSSGVWAHVLFLYQTAQEISILNGRECVDIQALENAYQRMRMLHTYIQPDASLKKVSPKRKSKPTSKKVMETACATNGQVTASATEKSIMEHPTNKGRAEGWTFADVAKDSKQKHEDMVKLLQGKVSLTEIEI